MHGKTIYTAFTHRKYDNFGLELRKVVDDKLGYDTVIKSVVIYTDKGIISMRKT